MVLPSRNSNPFASCWTSPGLVKFVPSREVNPQVLGAQLAQHGWRGQIVGRHGAGKSTLLEALRPVVEAMGREWLRVDFYAGRTSAAWTAYRRAKLDDRSLLVVDGYEQISWLSRYRMRRRCQRLGAGLLVTTHQSVGLPTLVEVRPVEQTIHQVFRNLVAECPTPLTDADFHDAFSACEGDIRQMFSNLYDLHECRVRDTKSSNRPARQPVTTSVSSELLD